MLGCHELTITMRLFSITRAWHLDYIDYFDNIKETEEMMKGWVKNFNYGAHV